VQAAGFKFQSCGKNSFILKRLPFCQLYFIVGRYLIKFNFWFDAPEGHAEEIRLKRINASGKGLNRLFI
jgi:hypothetical protein